MWERGDRKSGGQRKGKGYPSEARGGKQTYLELERDGRFGPLPHLRCGLHQLDVCGEGNLGTTGEPLYPPQDGLCVCMCVCVCARGCRKQRIHTLCSGSYFALPAPTVILHDAVFFGQGILTTTPVPFNLLANTPLSCVSASVSVSVGVRGSLAPYLKLDLNAGLPLHDVVWVVEAERRVHVLRRTVLHQLETCGGVQRVEDGMDK